ncbi:hypothetical protein MIND_00194400 [Mycena indigotica]|uniref:Uncharacterized protein n=1 Tax=Mycena indigotica TaxID=2126181 RepID=A0A8H6WEG8_9AGAR|nr:uncharacterized protein MIND_00194400 [Mycena indigotica]KAF7311838.1 hypothetical protein MIND_00194400 [Mycena indigotica]
MPGASLPPSIPPNLYSLVERLVSCFVAEETRMLKMSGEKRHNRQTLLLAASSILDPRLPPELEREIFETAALLHHKSIPLMLRVARRVLTWIEPFLYRNLELGMSSSNDEPEAQRLQTVLAKTDEFLYHAVRYLILGPSFVYHLLTIGENHREKLASMRNVVYVAIAGKTDASEATTAAARGYLFSVLENMPLLRLACYAEDIMSGAALNKYDSRTLSALPIFRRLTHFDVFDEGQSVNYSAIRTVLMQLPALTHLALSHDNAQFAQQWRVRDLLAGCPKLQVLVCLRNPDRRFLERDLARFVAIDIRLVPLIYNRWFEGATQSLDGQNYWDRAEELVAQRRAQAHW